MAITALTVTQFVEILDRITALYDQVAQPVANANGVLTITAPTTQGFGDNTILSGAGTDYGAFYYYHALEKYVLQAAGGGTPNFDIANYLLASIHGLANALPLQKMIPIWLSAPLQALASYCQASASVIGDSSIVNINTFALHYNTGSGGPNGAMLPPEYGIIHQNVFGVALSKFNLYSPPITTTSGSGGVGNANGMGKWVASGSLTGAFSAGVNVNALYAGVFTPRVVTTGFAGSSDTVTVTGLNQNGVSHTWTGTVAGNGTVTLTPTVAGDLLASVTAISPGAAITGGTFIIIGITPTTPNGGTARVYPPAY